MLPAFSKDPNVKLITTLKEHAVRQLAALVGVGAHLSRANLWPTAVANGITGSKHASHAINSLCHATGASDGRADHDAIDRPLLALLNGGGDVHRTAGAGGPTLVTEQRVSDGALATHGWTVFPRANRLVMFDGRLLHGVIPGRGVAPAAERRRRGKGHGIV